MSISFTKQSSEVIRLLQITDCHLGKHFGHQLAGMDTDASLQAVLKELPTEGVDLLLATGDLADRGASEAYVRLKEYLKPLNYPVFYLPGNHDDKTVMAEILAESTSLIKVIKLGAWQIILLDSTIHHQVGGYFDPSELEFLKQQLDAEPELNALVSFHHPLMPVGCFWLDEQRISNAAEFEKIAQQYPQLKVVVCGHVHQVFESTVGSAKFYAAPSTCAQFAPDSADFKIDQKNPGWRSLELFPDGSVRTEVKRIEQNLIVDLQCGGY